MAKNYDYDVAVIGAGPGGYVAAIRATQLGLKTALIERDALGGVCLNVGCIPSKALIHQAELFLGARAMERYGAKFDTTSFDYRLVHAQSRKAADTLSKGVQHLIKKNKITLHRGDAKITSPEEISITGAETKKIAAKNIIIATGSRPKEIKGFEFDEKQILSSTGLLMLQELPKHIAILGAGYIGMEFAFVMNAFGVEVTVIEMVDRILPTADREAAEVIQKAFEGRGIKIRTSHKALKVKKNAKNIVLDVESGAGKKESIEADRLLVAIGRSPNSHNLGLEAVGVKTERDFIVTGDYYRTSIPTIYAIGDVIATPMLAHVASKEGEIAVEHIAQRKGAARLDPNLIPGAVYTQPELASFGPTEEALKEQGVKYKKSVFPYQGAGKTVAIGHSNGMVKLLYHPDTHEIIACHIAGIQATEIIHEVLLARSAELLPEDIANMVHAHPTVSEAIAEANRGIEGKMIHF